MKCGCVDVHLHFSLQATKEKTLCSFFACFADCISDPNDEFLDLKGLVAGSPRSTPAGAGRSWQVVFQSRVWWKLS